MEFRELLVRELLKELEMNPEGWGSEAVEFDNFTVGVSVYPNFVAQATPAPAYAQHATPVEPVEPIAPRAMMELINSGVDLPTIEPVSRLTLNDTWFDEPVPTFINTIGDED